MRRLPILKTLISILFFASIITLIFSIPFIVIVSIMPDRVPFTFGGKETEAGNHITIELIVYIAALIAGFGFFTYALYLFRKVLDLFSKKIVFDIRVITYLDQCGKAVLTGYFICIIAEFFYKMITGQEIDLKLNFGFDGSIAVISLGLFFMVLSEVFLIAKKNKEEKDLTA